MRDFSLSPEVLYSIAKHAQECDPRECCGVLLGDKTGQIRFAAPIENSAQHPKDSYQIDPLVLDRVYDQAARSGLRVLGLYHSHVEVGAYFSSIDHALAVDRGEPMYLLYVVAGVRAGRCDEINSFTWDGHEFIAASLPL